MQKSKSKEMIFYVATNGKDSWSGRFSKPNKEKTDGPFATIIGVQNAVRKLRKAGKPKAPIRILIRGGEYYLKKPVVFTSEDSGSVESSVVYSAYPGEKPIISGGQQVKWWKETRVNGKKMWMADLPGALKNREDIRELFINGERRRRPKLPKEGFYQIADAMIGIDKGSSYATPQRSFGFAQGDIIPWKNLTDAEVVVLHYWAEAHLKIESVDTKKKIVSFQNESRRSFSTHGDKQTKYYVENVFEAIEPGEWYLNRKPGKIYYMPLEGEEIENINAVIPKLEVLVRIDGKPTDDKYVEHVHFENLRFSHASVSFEKIAASKQAAVEVSGAIQFEGAQNCSVRNCELAHVGTYGIELSNGCRGNHIVGNHIFDIGAGGIKVNGAMLKAAVHNSSIQEFTMNNIISDNHIHHGGKIAHCAVGILIGHSGGNTVSHNHIHDLYYTGISVGWVWGYNQSIATNNLIEYNHIHDLGHGWLSDMGGIYTLGLSTGTVLRRNLIHDVKCNVYGGWGIYFDEGTTNIVAEENIVYNCQTGGFFQHYGKNNIVRNNIFGPSQKYHFQRHVHVEEEHCSYILTRNIFYIKGGEFLEGKWFGPGYIFDKNIYWRVDGKELRFSKWSFQEWQERGQDPNSLVVDPLFKDPKNGAFILSPDSPAFKLGFKPIDTSRIGLKKEK